MQPTFRTDLACAREEQQGVVFYRIDDPLSKSSFRLYEIEYLIAQKLDGVRSLQQVIEAVKAEYNFDIDQADLQKFISQLESMGFVKHDESVEVTGEMSGQAPPMEITTREILIDDGGPAAAPRGRDTLEMMEETLNATVDQGELTRLLKSAFMHVKQGYLVHARDYLLAAKELSPHDGRLLRLVSTVEVLGDEVKTEEIERLWKQCREQFPDIAAEIGAPVGGERAAAKVAAAADRNEDAWKSDTRTRIGLMAVVLCLIAAGAYGLYFAKTTYHLFEGAVKVRTQVLQATRVPVLYPGSAVGAQPAHDLWLNFEGSGELAAPLVKVGTRVQAGDVVASYELPAKVQKGVMAARDGVKKATADYAHVAAGLEKVLADRQAIAADKQAAEDKLKQLRPQLVLKPDPAVRKELERWKKEMVRASKRLGALAKRERAPRAAEAKSKKKLDAAQKRLAALESKLADKFVRAKFSGEVTEVKFKVGDKVAAGDNVVHVRDSAVLKVAFNVPTKGTLAPGGEVTVGTPRGATVPAKVASVQEGQGGFEVWVEIPDPTGALVAMSTTSFRLVREYADPAFKVRTPAVLDPHGHAQVLLVMSNSVTRHPVQVLNTDAGDTVVVDAEDALHSDTALVVERLDGQDIASLPDGSTVQTGE